MPAPKVYAATEAASVYHRIKPLTGTRKAAQAYVDRVTDTDWWLDHCPGYYEFSEPPPDRVWIWQGEESYGAHFCGETATFFNGEEFPSITVGHGYVNFGVQAMADRWVLLHELAHVMLNQVRDDGHHGKQFIYTYHALVRQFLGRRAAEELKRQCKIHKVRVRYGLLLS